MKAEREIAGIALPFAAGLASSLYIGTVHTSEAAASIVMTSALLIILMLSFRKSFGKTVQWSIIICLMGVCGYLAGATDTLISVSRLEHNGWLESKALGFCSDMEAAIDRLPFKHEDTGQIIKALITGERSGIPKGITDSFRKSGASHILALSGLHLGIIYGIIRTILGALGNTSVIKNLRSAIAVALCGFYTVATGAGASITRAFIFIMIREYASVRRIHLTLPMILMASLMIQLASDPDDIRNIGFQLSYAAMAGIAWIFPWLQGFWPTDKRHDTIPVKCVRWIWNSAALSISCQITTGPLAYWYFGSIPQHFLLTNLIAIPLASIIIPMSLLTLAFSGFGWNPGILISATEWLITSFCSALEVISLM